MKIFNIIPFLLVVIGLFINTIFGLYYKSNFTIIMIKNIILTISLTVCGILISNILKNRYLESRKNRINKKKSYRFETYVPPISNEEISNLNDEEDEFQQLNPADLYKKNSSV